jgi:DNA helicase II / ATP-dependent DNA helicase PcrA
VKDEDAPLDPSPVNDARQTIAAIRRLEESVVAATGLEGIALRHRGFYGPGHHWRRAAEMLEPIRKRLARTRADRRYRASSAPREPRQRAQVPDLAAGYRILEHVFESGSEDSWLDELNDQQRAAATAAPDRPLLILAGAGSGKTATLSARVAWLIAQGIAPERILLLTFTRRAARELLTRTRALLARAGIAARGQVFGGTFHSVGWRLVRLYAEPLGLPPRLSVLDAGDGADLLDLVRQELGYAESGRRFPRKATLADIYSRTVNAQRPLSHVLAEQFPWCEPYAQEIGRIFSHYGQRKRDAQALDLDDLLLYWRALATHETAGARLAAMFEHLLVDEYQDVNALQVDIVQALRPQNRGLTVVGDDLQAIYGFRAASAEHILSFPKLFTDAATGTLEQNYRSTQPILDVANVVATQAERRHPKRLRSVRGDGRRPRLVFCRDEAEEASAVADRVLAEHERGVALRAQAVLMRTAHHSDLLELELGRRRIPYVKYGGIRYLEAAHVKDFLSLLRLLSNPADRVSWFRVLQLLEGVGPRTAGRILEALDLNLATLVVQWACSTAVPEAARVDGAALVEALAAAGAKPAPGVQAGLLRDALAPFIRRRYPDAQPRLHDLGILADAAAKAASLEQFAAELALDPPQSSADFAGPPKLEEDYLVLSTIHSAKGLEWDIVHLIHASDGNLPSDMALSNREGLEEERRLLYVALTRARWGLSIYVPVRYFHRPRGIDDASGLGKTSRFLTDEVESLCELVQPTESAPPLVGAQIHEQVTVAVDALWG